MKKCKFCNSKINKIKVVNFKFIKKNNFFYNCQYCKIEINPKKYNEKIYVYEKRNINFSGKKNIIYYLKSFFLFFFYLKIKKYFQKNKKLNILDFGSGSGEFTNILLNSKHNIYASDYLFNKPYYSKNIYFIDAKHIFKKKYHKKFDIIILRHVLEHIYNLKVFFKKLKKISKNNHVKIIMEVPNYESFWKKVLKNRWPGYFYPYHHYVFSKKFLKNHLSKNNLKIIKISNVETPIVGSYFYSLGLNRNLCKIVSIFLYPIQFFLSKLNFKSESILLVLKYD